MSVLKFFFLFFLFLSLVLIPSCIDTDQDRLEPSGKSVQIPQGNQFCQDNPKDDLCSE